MTTERKQTVGAVEWAHWMSEHKKTIKDVQESLAHAREFESNGNVHGALLHYALVRTSFKIIIDHVLPAHLLTVEHKLFSIEPRTLQQTMTYVELKIQHMQTLAYALTNKKSAGTLVRVITLASDDDKDTANVGCMISYDALHAKRQHLPELVGFQRILRALSTSSLFVCLRGAYGSGRHRYVDRMALEIANHRSGMDAVTSIHSIDPHATWQDMQRYFQDATADHEGFRVLIIESGRSLQETRELLWKFRRCSLQSTLVVFLDDADKSVDVCYDECWPVPALGKEECVQWLRSSELVSASEICAMTTLLLEHKVHRGQLKTICHRASRIAMARVAASSLFGQDSSSRYVATSIMDQTTLKPLIAANMAKPGSSFYQSREHVLPRQQPSPQQIVLTLTSTGSKDKKEFTFMDGRISPLATLSIDLEGRPFYVRMDGTRGLLNGYLRDKSIDVIDLLVRWNEQCFIYLTNIKANQAIDRQKLFSNAQGVFQDKSFCSVTDKLETKEVGEITTRQLSEMFTSGMTLLGSQCKSDVQVQIKEITLDASFLPKPLPIDANLAKIPFSCADLKNAIQ